MLGLGNFQNDTGDPKMNAGLKTTAQYSVSNSTPSILSLIYAKMSSTNTAPLKHHSARSLISFMLPDTIVTFCPHFSFSVPFHPGMPFLPAYIFLASRIPYSSGFLSVSTAILDSLWCLVFCSPVTCFCTLKLDSEAFFVLI